MKLWGAYPWGSLTSKSHGVGGQPLAWSLAKPSDAASETGMARVY